MPEDKPPEFIYGGNEFSGYAPSVSWGLNVARHIIPQMGAAPLVPGAEPNVVQYPASGSPRPSLPPEARLSDLYPRVNLTARDIAADQQINQMIRSAIAKIGKIQNPEERDRATDRIFSASVSSTPAYSIAAILQKLGL